MALTMCFMLYALYVILILARAIKIINADIYILIKSSWISQF